MSTEAEVLAENSDRLIKDVAESVARERRGEERAECRVEIVCPSIAPQHAAVRVNGKWLPLLGLTLQMNRDEPNRVILDVQATDLSMVVDAVPGVRVLDADGTPD
jgi:hypothetical protein